jgi:aminomethyltransferase
VFGRATGAQVGRATSGTWSPTLKRNIALASLESRHASPETQVRIEWTIEATRQRIAARVVPLPFLDLPRKRS